MVNFFNIFAVSSSFLVSSSLLFNYILSPNCASVYLCLLFATIGVILYTTTTIKALVAPPCTYFTIVSSI